MAGAREAKNCRGMTVLILSARSNRILACPPFGPEMRMVTGQESVSDLAILLAIRCRGHGFFRSRPSVDWDSIRNRYGPCCGRPPTLPRSSLALRLPLDEHDSTYRRPG